MDHQLALIGVGEAGAAFAGHPGTRGYDRKLDAASTALAMRARMAAAGVDPGDTAAAALAGATVAICAVTADQALAAAVEGAPALAAGTLWLDMNSAAPETKRAAACVVEASGGRYVDVAVMAPVLPARRAVPLLVAGPYRDAALSALAAIGFTAATAVEGDVGAASTIKLVRSVMVKGIEALSAECAVAAHAAGVVDAVVASLDASWPGADWRRRFDYNLDRILVHGARRAAEMDEAAATLTALGVAPIMTHATATRQRALGTLHIAPPAGLAAKLAVVAPFATTPAREAAA